MKRKIAAALAIVMVGASYATPFVNAADDTTSGSLEGTGSKAYVDTSKINVVVPTNSALNFTIDPQGLVALAEDKDATSKTEAQLKSYSGRILGNSALIFANKSVKDVKIATKFRIDETVASGGSSVLAATKQTDAQNKTNSNKLNLTFLAVPTSQAIGIEYGDGEKTASSTSLAKASEFKIGDFTPAAKGVLLSTSDVEVDTVLEAADHVFVQETNGDYAYELNTAKDNSAVGFVIAGFCNPYASYKDFDTSSVKIKATYEFSLANDTDSTAAKTATDGYRTTFASSATKVDIGAANVVTTVGSTNTNAAKTYTFDGTNDIVINDSAVKTNATITFTPVSVSSGSTTPITRTVAANSSHIAITNGVSLTVKGSWLAKWANAAGYGTGTYSVSIPDSDGEYVIVIPE